MRACLDCGVVCKGTRCPTHQRQYNQRRMDTTTQRDIRNSTAWRRLSKAKRARDPYCQPCLEHGVLTIATQVHHPNPRSKDGALLVSLDELQSVCDRCHGRLGMEERRRAGGVPRDRDAGTARRADQGPAHSAAVPEILIF